MKYKNISNNSVYSRNNLPKIKNRAYAINIDEYKSIENYWVALYMNSDNVTYLDSFRAEHDPEKKTWKEIKTSNQIFIEYQQMIILMCGYFVLDLIILSER